MSLLILTKIEHSRLELRTIFTFQNPGITVVEPNQRIPDAATEDLRNEIKRMWCDYFPSLPCPSLPKVDTKIGFQDGWGTISVSYDPKQNE